MINLHELSEETAKLVICGGGHVAIPVIRLGRMLGFRVTVLEDRPDHAENAGKAGADEVIRLPFQEGLAHIPGDQDTYFVIVTRGHAFDDICLNAISRKPHAYIGVMASKTRSAMTRERMITAYGCDPMIIQSVHMPIGLDIGSETPEEIAVSILAEIVQVKSKKHKTAGWTREIMQAIRQENRGPLALATIVDQQGSSPRHVGTRMLIRPDGSIVGTIGGGILESRVIREGTRLLREGGRQEYLLKATLDANTAEADEMACGGEVSVRIETLY